MQMKKQEVEEAILKNAEIEFYIHGFEKASIRKIVKASGTTIGNFYNYFDNKEALFDAIVRDEYNNFLYFLNKHDQIEKPDYLWSITDPKQWREVLTQLLSNFMPEFSTRFVILLECSEKTKYESTKKLVVDLIIEHFNEHAENYGLNQKDYVIGEILAEQLLSGMISILRKFKDNPEKKKETIVEYLLFYFLGTMALLGQ